MAKERVQIGVIQDHWNVGGTRILKFTVEIFHEGLNEHKLVSAPEEDILENKVTLQIQKWKEKWNRLESKRMVAEEKQANLEEASSRTNECQKNIEQIDNILIHTLSIDDTVDWETLKRKDKFKEEQPPKPRKKSYKELPEKPDEKSSKYIPTFSIWEKIFKSKKEAKITEFENKYTDDVKIWERRKATIEKHNREIDLAFDKEAQSWKKEVADWKKREKQHYEKQLKCNTKIDAMKEAYLGGDAKSIIEYCEMVLNNSQYPDSFPTNFELEYKPESKILIVEYELPSLEDFPNVKEVKYIASQKELKKTLLSSAAINKMFDSAIYKITLRTIHELFEADAANAIEAVSFNGWVNSIDKATGNETTNCIVSIQAKKDEFLNINLSKVEPKICFKKLKGVASTKLNTLTPVQPILKIDKTDKRFVDSYDVAHEIDNSTNLAAMDWEDFEHLVRELFEKEFVSGGGEVKVTQASKDGGVDAIAFDPDPIRGGKIVIQAKRYTNVVGVSAVRDLYGTVVNEGANKGILVTTADYGPDAYNFAKDKPLTLLNGSNLLHLLEQHGHHAKIDLKEAKRILAEQA